MSILPRWALDPGHLEPLPVGTVAHHPSPVEGRPALSVTYQKLAEGVWGRVSASRALRPEEIRFPVVILLVSSADDEVVEHLTTLPTEEPSHAEMCMHAAEEYSRNLFRDLPGPPVEGTPHD